MIPGFALRPRFPVLMRVSVYLDQTSCAWSCALITVHGVPLQNSRQAMACARVISLLVSTPLVRKVARLHAWRSGTHAHSHTQPT